MSGILVVDDDADVCSLMVRLLHRLGYKAECETSGSAALAHVGVDMPDLVLLDVMMPGMNGIEVLRRLRSDQTTAKLPVIMFSALSDPQVRGDAMKLGANEYWVKASIDMGEIVQRLNKYLPVQ